MASYVLVAGFVVGCLLLALATTRYGRRVRLGLLGLVTLVSVLFYTTA